MTTPSESQPEPVAGPPERGGPGVTGPEESPAGADRSLPAVPANPPAEEPPLLDVERIPSREDGAARRHAARPAAWTIAVIADVVQWILWPLFVAGAASPFDDIVDLVVAGMLIRLLGWHWAFLPSFLAKLIPGVDLVPTWTVAVFIATRGAPGPGA